MDQVYINVAFAIISMLSGWIIRMIYDSQKELKDEITELHKNISETYVRRDDFKDQIQDIKKMCEMILDRLDKKADK
jgi:cell division protein FtsL